MRLKKTAVSLLSLLLAAALCAGCSQGGDGGQPVATNDAAAPSSQQDSTPVDRTEIVVMTSALNGDEYEERFKENIAQSLPQLAVTFEVGPLAYADKVNKYTTMIASGDNSIDVFDIDEIMQLAFLSADFLEPIGDVVTEEEMQKFLPGYKEQFLQYEGELYGVPNTFTAILFYVNQQMFDEAGISVPTNKEEFIAAAQALTGDGKYGLLETWDKSSHLQDCLNRWSLMFGGNFYDWNLPGTQEAIQFMYDLVNTYEVMSIDNLSDNSDTANQKMNDGLAAMYFNWTSASNTFASSGKFGTEIVVAPVPTFVTNHTPMSSWIWVVNKNSPNTDGAKQFVKAMAREDLQAGFLAARTKVPTANVKAWEDEELVKDLLLIKEHKDYLDDGSLIPRTLCDRHSEYMDTVTGTLQRYLLDEISFEDCIEQGQAQIERLLS